MVKANLKKKKKKWFEVKANLNDKSISVGEILAYELKELVGRRITIGYDQISGNPKDQKTKIDFKIVNTKGSDGIAEPRSIYYQDSFIVQKIKRDKTRNIIVIMEKTKDGKQTKTKCLFSAKGRIDRSINSALIKYLEINIREIITKATSDRLFEREFIKKETSEIKEKARKIYPVDKLYIWKLSLL